MLLRHPQEIFVKMDPQCFNEIYFPCKTSVHIGLQFYFQLFLLLIDSVDFLSKAGLSLLLIDSFDFISKVGLSLLLTDSVDFISKVGLSLKINEPKLLQSVFTLSGLLGRGLGCQAAVQVIRPWSRLLRRGLGCSCLLYTSRCV